MRKDRESQGEIYQPKYFEKYVDPVTGEEGFKYGGGRDYWTDRKNKNWAHLEDLF
jgi:hypothetical protein